MVYDNCPNCEEKDVTIEQMQGQLDDIRGIIEDYCDHDELYDEVMGVLER